MGTPRKVTTRRGCATTATTNTGERRNHGIVVMKNYMRVECAKTVILIDITERKEKQKISTKRRNRCWRKKTPKN